MVPVRYVKPEMKSDPTSKRESTPFSTRMSMLHFTIVKMKSWWCTKVLKKGENPGDTAHVGSLSSPFTQNMYCLSLEHLLRAGLCWPTEFVQVVLHEIMRCLPQLWKYTSSYLHALHNILLRYRGVRYALKKNYGIIWEFFPSGGPPGKILFFWWKPKMFLRA